MALGRLRVTILAALAALTFLLPRHPLHAGTPPPLSLYGNLPGVEGAALSPSGDLLAMVGMADGARRLVVLDKEKRPLLALPLDDAKIRGIYWAGEDMVLVHATNTTRLDADFYADKAELSSMIVVPLNGEKMWAVFAKDKRITGGIQHFLGIQERNGRYYGYFSGLTYSGDFRSPEAYLTNGGPILYEVDLQNQQANEIAPKFHAPGFRDWLMGPDGKVSATLDYTSRSGSWLIRNAAGQKITEGTNPLGRIDLIGHGVTPGTLIFREQIDDDDARWFEIPLAGGTRTEILANVSIKEAILDHKTRQLVGYREEGTSSSYKFFTDFRQKVVNATIKAFPNLLISLVDWNDRFDQLLVKTEGVGDPQTWWTVDIKTGNAREIGYSYPIASADVGPMRAIRYKAGDGTEIEGVLTLPPGRPARDLPVILLPHGGPASRDYVGFDWWAQAFASRGYAVLQPNFRGSTGYGIAFRQAGNGQWGRKMQSDISDGLSYIAAEGIVDPKRACIVGASYGGYAALAGVTLQHGLYRCAVSVSGVSDVAKMAVNDGRFDRTMKRAIETEIGKHADLTAISPIAFASQADAPVLLIHGTDDIVVPFDQSNDMARALRKAGKPVEFVTLKGEDHWLSRGETRLAMLTAALKFVEAHNPPDKIP